MAVPAPRGSAKTRGGRPRRHGVTNIVKPQAEDPVRDLRFRLGIERSGVGDVGF